MHVRSRLSTLTHERKGNHLKIKRKVKNEKIFHAVQFDPDLVIHGY